MEMPQLQWWEDWAAVQQFKTCARQLWTLEEFWRKCFGCQLGSLKSQKITFGFFQSPRTNCVKHCADVGEFTPGVRCTYCIPPEPLQSEEHSTNFLKIEFILRHQLKKKAAFLSIYTGSPTLRSFTKHLRVSVALGCVGFYKFMFLDLVVKQKF